MTSSNDGDFEEGDGPAEALMRFDSVQFLYEKGLTHFDHYGAGSLPQYHLEGCRGELLTKWRWRMRRGYSDLKTEHGIEDAGNFHPGHGGTEERLAAC